MKIKIPKFTLKDRVDILARKQRVEGQRIEGTSERVVHRRVRCNIQTSQAAPYLAMMGLTMDTQLIGVFEKTPVIEEGWILRVPNSGVRYNVKSVEFYPSPHDFEFQVATLVHDTTGARH